MSFIETIKFKTILYFSNNICPAEFPTISEGALKNDFYEVHIYVHSNSDEELDKMSKSSRGALNVGFEFLPDKTKLEFRV